MRSRFDEQLEALHTELIEMGALCENAISNAAQALLEGDLALARRAAEFDHEIDDKERKIESLALKLLLFQQPVARDLRQVSAALKMITDMERIGDQAADIAEITTLANIVPEDTLHVNDMARATIKMVTESIDAFVQADLKLARAVMDYDDVVDDLFDQVKKELIELIGKRPERGEYAIDLLMIAKYFERIGDHAVNIAEWVEFSITGIHKGENAL
ncbi:MAG TPA: phosphate signaling complex protein PhoU [Clostridia bacterium]|nr:phosphate signaling complex protein PhoU [Clostridia bacterium]